MHCVGLQVFGVSWQGKVSCTLLNTQGEFESLHFSSQCLWTRAEDLLPLLWAVPVSPWRECCPVSWVFAGQNKREIKQVIPKRRKGNAALAGSRWWLRSTACFFIGFNALHLPEDFFFPFFIFSFSFLQGEIVWLRMCDISLLMGQKLCLGHVF